MSTFTSIHKYYSNCYNENGEFDEEKAKSLIKSFVYYGEDRLRILKSVYDSVLNVSFLNEFARLYLVNSNMTFRDIGKMYNENLKINEEFVKDGTCRSKIERCSNKVNEIFEDIEFGKDKFDIITWLIDSNTFRLDNDDNKKELREKFLGQLNEFIERYIDKPVIDKKDLVITLPRCEKVREINQEEFEDFMNIIRPYSKREMKRLQDTIDIYSKCIGYLNYIMSPKSELNDIDRENRSDVLRWLGKENDLSIEVKKFEDKLNNTSNNDEVNEGNGDAYDDVII